MQKSTGHPAGETRIRALLGPTNTGKTHFALERMLAYSTGMIGFPLRLLARENYDRVVKAKGAAAVALITGEEKIVPANARYFMCTVEAMPVDRRVEFLGVDEIQLCADPERGHIFTDRLLRARGSQETMFMGAETIRPLIRRLVPGIEIEERPRLSDLAYTGHAKLTRLPTRSAIVAFSISDVYDIAEMIRRQRGGTAVVLGALSPRTRNAQVEMYQGGEVDYMVATDAIGMGLNMDVRHVAFARMNKYDGRNVRGLDHAEIAQIAGRAGRFRTDGTFGVTGDVRGLTEEAVEAIENHRFNPLKRLYWRNPELDLASVKGLIKSLERPAPDRALGKGRPADDVLTLKALARNADIAAMADSPQSVALLWDVCRIPDFRKTLSESHTALVGRVYSQLCSREGRLSVDWVSSRIKRLDNISGDADTLMSRIAHIRTWTYISHQSGWLDDPAAWQDRTRAIEDKLSDALHEALTKRFVDRRAAVLIQRLESDTEMLAGVKKDGTVVVEGHQVGHLEGFRFVPDIAEQGEHSRALLAAARKTLREEIAMRTRQLETAAHEDITLETNGQITWAGHPLADLIKGQSPLLPEIKVVHSDVVTEQGEQRVRDRLNKWLREEINDKLGQLVNLTECGLKGAPAGIAFQLQENFGSMPRHYVAELADSLEQDDRRELRRAGIDLGPDVIYMPQMMKLAAVRLRAILWSVFNGLELPPALPNDGRASVAVDKRANRKYYNAIGYPILGPLAVRADMVTRLVRAAYDKAEDYKFAAGPDLANPVGCSLDDLAGVFKALGFRPAPPEEVKAEEVKAEEAPAEEKPVEEAATEEAVGDEAAKKDKKPPQEAVIFQLRRKGGARPSAAHHKGGKPGHKGPGKGHGKGRGKGGPGKGRPGGHGKPRKEKEISPDSPFAVLAQLKEKQLAQEAEKKAAEKAAEKAAQKAAPKATEKEAEKPAETAETEKQEQQG